MYQHFVNFLSHSEKQQKMIPIGGSRGHAASLSARNKTHFRNVITRLTMSFFSYGLDSAIITVSATSVWSATRFITSTVCPS